MWGWAVLARLPGLLRLFGLGRVRGCTGMRLCLSTCRGRETGLLPGARLSGLWRLFGLGCVRGRTGMRLCLSTCRRCETGLLSGARLLGLRGRAVLEIGRAQV